MGFNGADICLQKALLPLSLQPIHIIITGFISVEDTAYLHLELMSLTQSSPEEGKFEVGV